MTDLQPLVVALIERVQDLNGRADPRKLLEAQAVSAAMDRIAQLEERIWRLEERVARIATEVPSSNRWSVP
jgi:hypothetical protein